MFDNDTIVAAVREAKALGVEPAALLAVAQVESAGKIYALVDGRQEPLVRFEGHYFYKRVVNLERVRAMKAGLAGAMAGAVKNPASQQARWDRLIKPAAAIDRQAAYESVSWGLGQVMGAHWKWLGYASVLALVEEARSGAGGQIALMARFIEKSGLDAALRRGDWAAFAKGYNGPAYKKNAYDVNMAKAYAKWVKVDFSKYSADDKPKPVAADVKAAEPVPPKERLLPDPDRIAKDNASFKTGAKAGGVLAALAALGLAMQCALPTWFINWAGYAATCTKGVLP